MDKNYEPEVVPEVPFPGEPQLVPLSTPSNPVGTYSPSTTKEKTFPVKRRAVELLSTAMNTRSRKILQEFKLEQSGGFQVGNYQEGVTGDIRITPNGITARNVSGITTISIDGDTGDAIFAGELQTGSIITGTVIVEDGNIALYNDGILQIFIGDDGT